MSHTAAFITVAILLFSLGIIVPPLSGAYENVVATALPLAALLYIGATHTGIISAVLFAWIGEALIAVTFGTIVVPVLATAGLYMLIRGYVAVIPLGISGAWTLRNVLLSSALFIGLVEIIWFSSGLLAQWLSADFWRFSIFVKRFLTLRAVASALLTGVLYWFLVRGAGVRVSEPAS